MHGGKRPQLADLALLANSGIFYPHEDLDSTSTDLNPDEPRPAPEIPDVTFGQRLLACRDIIEHLCHGEPVCLSVGHLRIINSLFLYEIGEALRIEERYAVPVGIHAARLIRSALGTSFSEPGSRIELVEALVCARKALVSRIIISPGGKALRHPTPQEFQEALRWGRTVPWKLWFAAFPVVDITQSNEGNAWHVWVKVKAADDEGVFHKRFTRKPDAEGVRSEMLNGALDWELDHGPWITAQRGN